MNTPSTQALLDVLDRRGGRSSTEQALDLLTLVSPGADPDEPGSLPVGERDRRLAMLRGCLFGHACDTVVDCPACHETLEFEVDSRLLFDTPTDSPSHAVSAAGYEVLFRLPTSHDLMAVSGLSKLSAARALLLQRCIERATTESGESVDAALLPNEVVEVVEAAMESADTLANPTLLLDCPNCGHHWKSLFDILGFFLQELDDWARQVFRDVHALARAHGWSEHDILAMSPWRRRIYLEMLET